MDVKTTQVDSMAERRAARRRNPDWSLKSTIYAVKRFVHVFAGHTADGYGGLAELLAAVQVQRDMADAIDTMARHLLEHEDCSYREIAAALGISTQAVAKRYRGTSSRPRGGQRAGLR
jgi:DNA-directed RNA polymerase specialized sigma24 family protein